MDLGFHIQYHYLKNKTKNFEQIVLEIKYSYISYKLFILAYRFLALYI